MNPGLTYENAIKNAGALKALGQTQVHLYGEDVEPPWHIANKCEPGGSFRHNIPTSAQFSGEQDGLTFTWLFDLEPSDANDKGTTRIDIAACNAVLAKINGPALVQFRTYLSDCAGAVKRQGDEYQVIADRQFRDAAILRDLVNYRVEK